jgi:hypothetical protein
MLIITDNTSGKVRKYATSDAELVNSLFNEGGTLDRLHNITNHNRKQAVFYWTEEDAGVYLYEPTGLWGKFRKLKNGRFFYQYTLDKIDLIED